MTIIATGRILIANRKTNKRLGNVFAILVIVLAVAALTKL